ncbi:MAG TPA: LacI family DNA-binding transcriptional regulator [Streptosporangiaceae bacterium]|nr:LacI family DNA-binding transcriptional regulator [Streptosporangiaceae bacterium]
MAYAERVPSAAGGYWRGRFKDPEGRYLTVRDEYGEVVRFGKKGDAKQAAEDRESDVRNGRWRDPAAGRITFAEWANEWYAGLDLAPSTMANIPWHLQLHLLPAFGTKALADIDAAMIAKWERAERAAGAMPASIRTWRGTLHTCLEDAVGTHIGVNPATRKRGRGKRSGRKSGNRGPEKVITDELGALLIAERMGILSGRDDEFVMVITAFWNALRLGELIGLEKAYARPQALRVEWQLHEVEGDLLRCSPKDESYGTLDQPPFLSRLLAAHIRDTRPQPCPCHGQAYVFRGMGRTRGPQGRVTLQDVAAVAGVSATVIAAVAGGKGRVGADTRAHVEKVIKAMGYERPAVPEGPAWHWRRSSFEELFTAAASGWFPPSSPLPRRPVPLAGDWPGTRVRGRNAQGRAEFCWLPVAEGLTPHGLRHSQKTWMEQARIHEVLSEDRLRHEIPGISGTYRHVTPAMRADLLQAMTRAWEAALDERREMSPQSPVAALAALLDERLEARKPKAVPRDSPGAAVPLQVPRSDRASELGRGGRI